MPDSRTHLFTNFALARLAVGVADSDTSIQLQTGQGGQFPSPGVDEIFKIAVENVLSGDREIMNVTDVTGDVLTVERAQEGTNAFNFSADVNTIVSHRVTGETLEWLASLGGGGGGGGGSGTSMVAAGFIEFTSGTGANVVLLERDGLDSTKQYLITVEVNLSSVADFTSIGVSLSSSPGVVDQIVAEMSYNGPPAFGTVRYTAAVVVKQNSGPKFTVANSFMRDPGNGSPGQQAISIDNNTTSPIALTPGYTIAQIFFNGEVFSGGDETAIAAMFIRVEEFQNPL